MKYFIINLSHRADRWKQMVRQMQSQQIQTYQRFDAIKPSWFSIEKTEIINRLCPFFFKNLLECRLCYSLGTVGAFLSHEKLLKEHKHETEPFVILEDDVEFCVPSIERDLNTIIDKIPSFDILVLYANKRYHIIREYKECLYETIPTIFGAYAYCIHPRIIPKIISELTIISNPFDIQLQKIIKSHYIQNYLTKTPIVRTPTILTRDSDICFWRKSKTSPETFKPSLIISEKEDSTVPPFIYCPFTTILNLSSIFNNHPSREIKIIDETNQILLLHICHFDSNDGDESQPLCFLLNNQQVTALFST